MNARDPREKRLYELIGKNIENRRSGTSQGDLAKAVGVARTSITNIESGRQRVPLHLLLVISDRLGCELGDLIPKKDTLLVDGRISVKVGNTETHVKPRTAEVIRQLLQEKEGPNEAISQQVHHSGEQGPGNAGPVFSTAPRRRRVGRARSGG